MVRCVRQQYTAATLTVIAECGRAEGEHGSKHKPVDALASIGGASGFADSSALQRMWRNANVALRHGPVNTDLV